ncbi:MAG: hypothetical protein JO078_09140 [Candidatus Eremiobacteraeota bacterium]|nr:hypothetical protein [Candidatus Eremiobacteraeota bacterium]
MTNPLIARRAIGCCVALMLAGCGGSQPPIAAPGAMPQSHAAATHAERGGSWMLPPMEGHKSVLIYASGVYGGVYVYDYFTGKQLGKLTGPGGPMCVDAKGNIYVAQNDGTTLEYAHGDTKIFQKYTSGATSIGCSVDARNDLAVTRESGVVTVFAGGDPSKRKTYSNPSCGPGMFAMGYDDKGNLLGLNDVKLPVTVCALLAGSKSETTLKTKSFEINAPGHTMWDGKYITLTDQAIHGKHSYHDGIVEASLSGSTLTSHGEPILTDTCDKGGGTDIVSPFILGERNTPVNHLQGKVIVAINSVCTAAGIYEIEFWHYPRGGDPYKVYKVSLPLSGVGTVSIGY